MVNLALACLYLFSCLVIVLVFSFFALEFVRERKRSRKTRAAYGTYGHPAGQERGAKRSYPLADDANRP